MIKYSLSYNPILEYWADIQSGAEVVSSKIKKTYQKVVRDLNKPGRFYYSAARANHVLEFAENYCCIIQGKKGGHPVVLELWEKALLATVFGFIDKKGHRKYQVAILIVGKKNGKSLLASIVGLYLQIADNEAGPEVYAVATKKDQAKKIWDISKKMVLRSPALRKLIKPLVASLESEFNDGSYKALGSNVDTMDGLNVHGALMDEFHQWKQGKALYDIIADGITAREQPLIFMTSTAGTIREDIYDQKYEEAERVINGYEDKNGYQDERLIAFVYELDARKEWTDEKCWKKANPGLGTIKSLEQLKEKVRRAKENPMLVKNLVCKEFNIRETSTEAWLTWEQINNTEVYDLPTLKPRYGIGGADLSSTTDLTAAKVLFMVPDNAKIYTLSMYWLPEDLLEQRVKEDKIPYDLWYERGLLRLCPGNRVHAKHVTEWFLEVQQEKDIYLPWFGYDAWSATYWVEEMKEYFGMESMIAVHQGKRTLSSPMKSLGADLDAKKIIYNDNPIDKWCLFNTSYDEDRNGNIQPCKTSRSTKRIDGTSALLNGYVVLQDKIAEYMSMI